MKKAWMTVILAAVMGTLVLAGCGEKKPYMGSWVSQEKPERTLMIKNGGKGKLNGNDMQWSEDPPGYLWIDTAQYIWKVEDKTLTLTENGGFFSGSNKIIYIRK